MFSMLRVVCCKNNNFHLLKLNKEIYLKNDIHIKYQLLAGHSKWANIKHTKALKDGKKSIIFTKLSRQIRIAIQDGGSVNPTLNTPLRNIIDEALKKNMPNATIKNILKKYNETNSSLLQLKKYIVEMKIINKILVICIIYTDNFPGLKMNLSTILRKAGGTFSTDTRHLFTDKGIINAELNGNLSDNFEDICMEHAINCGAEECEIIDSNKKNAIFICEPDHLDTVRNNLINSNWFVESSEHLFMANNLISVTDSELSAYNLFKDKLKAFDGVEEIYDNLNDDS